MNRAVALLLLVVVACHRKEATTNGSPIRIAAASDLEIALEEVKSGFLHETGSDAIVAYGSSGLLSKQIEEGAPFDVFLAADQSSIDRTVASQACDAATRAVLVFGRLAIWSREAQITAPDQLASPAIKRIAIANPEHAPYGRAAREALQSANLWDKVQPKLVYGENVRQALQLAETRNADVAIVALSLSQATKDGTSVLIDPRLHRPIEQTACACLRGKNASGGKAFLAYLQRPSSLSILLRHGFSQKTE